MTIKIELEIDYDIDRVDYEVYPLGATESLIIDSIKVGEKWVSLEKLPEELSAYVDYVLQNPEP